MNSLWYLYDTEFSTDVCADILSNWNDFEAQKGMAIKCLLLQSIQVDRVLKLSGIT